MTLPRDSGAPSVATQRVVRVEHGGPGARHGLHEHALDVGQLRERVDAVQAQVVGGHVGHHGHVVAVVAEALAQDAAASHLEHRACPRSGSGAPSGPTSGPLMSPFLISRPSMTMPSVVVMPTRRPISLRMWAIIRTVVVLPLVPVTRDDRDARVRAAREQQVDDRPRHVLRLALRGIGVHPEPGRGVDLHDRAALLPHRHGDVGDDEVDAGDVQADDARGRLGDLDVLGVGLHGPVDGGAAGRHVAGERELDAGARRRAPTSSVRPCFAISSSAASLSAIRVSTFSWPKPRRGSLFSMSTSSRTVCSPSAVDAGRDALGDRHHLSADHEHAVVVAVRRSVSTTTSPPRLSRMAMGKPCARPPPSAGPGSRRDRGCRRAA